MFSILRKNWSEATGGPMAEATIEIFQVFSKVIVGSALAERIQQAVAKTLFYFLENTLEARGRPDGGIRFCSCRLQPP